MIERDGNDQQIVCDGCSDNLDVFDKSDFGDMITNAKRNGCRIRTRAGEWQHHCQSCQELEKYKDVSRKFGR